MKSLFVVLTLCFAFSISYSQNSWTFYKKTSISGTLSGSIQIGMVLKTMEDEYFLINEPTIQIVIEIMPDVTILKQNERYKLTIDGFDEPVICKRLDKVISTQVDGDFNGWEGNTIFKMTNGQIWQQASYAYTYHYSYSPDVLIFQDNKIWKMQVEDVDDIIEVQRLK